VEFDSKEGNAMSIVHASDARYADDDDASSYFGPDGYAARAAAGESSITGRRLIIAPINTGVVYGGTGSNSLFTTAGFGAFLLMHSNGDDSICGQYLGTAIVGQPSSGGVAPGDDPPASTASFALRLVQ
jgi:hypothetical protein